MSFGTALPRNDYLGDGTQATFTYDFRIFEASDLRVVQMDLDGNKTVLLYPVDFILTGVNDPNGGTITLTAGVLPNGYLLNIRFFRTPQQQTDLRNQRSFYPEVHEDKFDEIVRFIQAMSDDVNRSLKLPEQEVGTDATTLIASVIQRASKFLAFDSAGNLITAAGMSPNGSPISTFAEMILQAADAASVRALLGISATTAVILKSIMTAKGDILAATSSGSPVIQSVGGNGTSLVGDSSQATGLRYGTVCPIGTVLEYGGVVLPVDHLWANGAAVSRTSFAQLFAIYVKSSVVTADSATDKITWVNHGFLDSTPIKFTNSGGALPGGLTAGVTYWIRDQTVNDFKICVLPGGSAIDLTSNGTGTHTAIVAPWGDGDGSTTFNLPNRMNRVGIGFGRLVITEVFTASAINTTTGQITVTQNSDRFITGMPFVFTTVSAPGGLTNGVTYYIIRIDNSTIQFASTLANAQNLIAIGLTTQGTGPHTMTFTSIARGLGEIGGEDSHAMNKNELLAHVHPVPANGTGASAFQATGSNTGSVSTGSTGGNAAANIMQTYIGMAYIVRYR